MPIKPNPSRYTCPACGWNKSVFPQSDALMPEDVVNQCPKCGEEHLKHEKLSLLDRLAVIFKRV